MGKNLKLKKKSRKHKYYKNYRKTKNRINLFKIKFKKQKDFTA